MFTDLWNYRQFIARSVHNEIINRFVRSKLGGLWVIINPLAQVAIYALILSNVLASKLPGIESKYAYAIYLMSGLLAWSLFSDIVLRSLNLFIEQANLIKKTSFPKATLPIIIAISNLVSNTFLFIAVLVIFLLLGQSFSLEVVLIFPLTLMLIGFSIGLGLILGIVNVFIRDLAQVVPIVLQILFWFTPIVYPKTIIPEKYQYLLELNPLYHVVSAYHQILAYGKTPELFGIVLISLLAFSLLMLGLVLFRRASVDILDVL